MTDAFRTYADDVQKLGFAPPVIDMPVTINPQVMEEVAAWCARYFADMPYRIVDPDPGDLFHHVTILVNPPE